VYLDIINRAQKYVHIMTPYLILDNEMVTALTFAAQRGVDVKLILPHIPDKKIIFAIARTYYMQLIEAGVHIYEFVPGFVHAKEFISDDCKAVVGTINLDFRSLYEHFECGTFIYKNPVIKDIEDDYQETLKKCMKIDYQFCIDLPIWYRMLGHVCRIFGPLV
jgi:cardiolipin synthase